MVIQIDWFGVIVCQVQEQIIDCIVCKLQEMFDVDFLCSYLCVGQLQLFFIIKDMVLVLQVLQIWYQVCKKVGDVVVILLQGVRGFYFNDEFGDVYINIYVLVGDGFMFVQLCDYVDQLCGELLYVLGVVKIDYFGECQECIYIDIGNICMMCLGISLQQLVDVISGQNVVVLGGFIIISSDCVYVCFIGQFDNVCVLEDKIIYVNNCNFCLGDIVIIMCGYDELQEQEMCVNGQLVLGIGVIMQLGGDVICLGKVLDE